MKKVFANISDNCLVLTIIGPQSSGKSTLLNFLFGCDFATS
jgi:GTPase Era involved in 16S rRNA processing